MGQPEPEQYVDAVSIEGLESFFDGVSATDANTSTATPPNSHAVEITVTASPVGWTLRQASENLGVSVNTIRKRIKDRELHGYKVLGPNGPEWRITPPQETTTPTSTPPPTTTAAVTDTPTIQTLLRVIATQEKQIEVASGQVKAATDVIMYQRAQLEERDNLIKLLTDSQHKAGIWRKFWSWFTGGGGTTA